jgi:hypothetical protein
MLSFLFLILPGLIVAYALFLRPELKKRFVTFYAEADGFWANVWVLCGKSATMAWAYFIQVFGWCLQMIDPIAAFLGDPDLKQQITDGLRASPQAIGYVMMVISAITLIARIRGIVKQNTDDQ